MFECCFGNKRIYIFKLLHITVACNSSKRPRIPPFRRLFSQKSRERGFLRHVFNIFRYVANLRREVEKNAELQQQLKYVVDEEKNVRDELKATRKEFEDYKKKAEEKIHGLQRQMLKLNSEVEEVIPKIDYQLKYFHLIKQCHLKVFYRIRTYPT